MTGPPTSSNGHGSRLPIRAQAAPMEENPVRAREAVTTDELSIPGQRPRAREAAIRTLHILTEHLQRHNLRMPIRYRHMIRKLYHRCKTPMRIRTPKSANHNVSSMNFAEPKLATLQIKVQRQDLTRTRPPCAIPRTTNRISETRVVEARIGFTRFLGRKVLSISYNIDYT